MTIKEITSFLEVTAPLSLQESYDNAGLISGNPQWDCQGALICLDCTEEVILEAVDKKCNLVIAHHPIVFKGLKKLTGTNYVERTIICAIKNNIAIYAIHTNLDNVLQGVNGKIAQKIGLLNTGLLHLKKSNLCKLAVFVPHVHKLKLLNALFAAGGGAIENYSECSFMVEGTGSFMPGDGANPFIGEKYKREEAAEVKIEILFPDWIEGKLLQAMRDNHPYETVAYDIYRLENSSQETGSGMIGDLPEPLEIKVFLEKLKNVFQIPAIRYSTTNKNEVKRIAVCGGAGSFLISKALAAGADAFVTSDVKYHEFFDGEQKLLITDIGHYESEQFTIDLLYDLLTKKYTNFAVLKTGVTTNPVHYFC